MSTIFESMATMLSQEGYGMVSQDMDRPWGGFFVIDETQAEAFANRFFKDVSANDLRIGGKLSPKILFVKPGQRLSWQYHHRRAEIWRVIEGEVAIQRSFTNEPGPEEFLKNGTQLTLKKGERHRLIGLSDWAVIAEIWQHTDPDHPSDENDIVRLQDDYGR